MSALRHSRCARILGALVLVLPAAAPLRAQLPVAADSGTPGGAVAAAAHERAARRGASVVVIDLAEVDLTTVRTLSDLLAARAPGVTVRRASGGAGAGAGVVMRGPTSVDDTTFYALGLAHEPLLVVDGIRADGSQRSLLLTRDAMAASRLDDYRLEDLATVEVLRGPAAAALYGIGAESGVIALTTRAGRREGAHAAMYARAAAVRPSTTYAPRYGRIDMSTGMPGCTLVRAAEGSCVPGPLVRQEALEGADPYEAGTETTVGGFVQGEAAGRLGFYLGGGVDDRPGLERANESRRGDLRARLDGTLAPGLVLTATGGYVHGTTRLPYVGGSAADPLARALIRQGDGTSPGGFFPLDFAARQTLTRTTAGATLSWTPAHWLSAGATYGADDSRTAERGGEPVVDPATYGGVLVRTTGDGRVRTGTASARVTATYAPTAALSGSTTVGYERIDRLSRDSIAWYSFDGQFGNASGAQWHEVERGLAGLTLAQRLAWQDRLVLDLGIRGDRANGTLVRGGDVELQRSAEVSWVLGGGPGSLRRLWSDRARLRAAYGRVGRARSRFAYIPSDFDPYPSGQEPAGPDPEHTREIEVGADASYLGGRVALSLTGYDKLTTDGEMRNATFGYVNFPPRGEAMDVRNRGLEMQVSAGLLRVDRLRWDATLTLAANRNRVTRLDVPSSFYDVHFGGATMVRDGEPLGIFVESPLVGFSDRNGDGIIRGCGYRPFDPVDPACELDFRTQLSFGGTPYPTREATLHSSLGVGRRVTLSGQLDYRGGARLYNATRLIRCAYENCRGQFDPSASLAEQAATGVLNNVTPYLEDAGYVKLRELAVAVHLPEGWVRPAGALTLTAAVRNVATWTRYSGGDPEVAASVSPLVGFDFFAQAQPRSFVLRAEIVR